MKNELKEFAQLLQPGIFDKVNLFFNSNSTNSYADMPYKGKASIYLGLKGKKLDELKGELAHEIAEIKLGPNEIHKDEKFVKFVKYFGTDKGKYFYYLFLLFKGDILKHEVEADKLAFKMIERAGQEKKIILKFLQRLSELERNFFLKLIFKKRIKIIQGLLN